MPSDFSRRRLDDYSDDDASYLATHLQTDQRGTIDARLAAKLLHARDRQQQLSDLQAQLDAARQEMETVRQTVRPTPVDLLRFTQSKTLVASLEKQLAENLGAKIARTPAEIQSELSQCRQRKESARLAHENREPHAMERFMQERTAERELLRELEGCTNG